MVLGGLPTHFLSETAMEWIILAFNNWVHYVFEVLGQNGPLGTKKRPFWAQIGYVKKWIFVKNIIFEKCTKISLWGQ